MVGLEVERGLTGPLVRGALDLDLVLHRDTLHDLTEGGGLVVPASGGEVGQGDGERVRELCLLGRSRHNARRTPC